MNATLYTGDGATKPSSQVITNGAAGQSFQPDMVWIKSRSNAYPNLVWDSIRGVANDAYLVTNTTAAENSDATGNQLSSFNSNGFSVQNTTGGSVGTNNSGSTFVAWNFKAGGTAVTNTSGTISAQVSANTTAGFSVVTYTGTSGAGTVGHGLGVAPSFIIAKSRTSAVNWITYHVSTGNSAYMNLNLTNASASLANYWGTSVNSSTFGFLSNTYDNANGNVVAYCFAPIAGYSAFGSYTGNGSTDGPFIYTGFRPRFVIFKRSDSTGNWQMIDTSINPYNNAGTDLFANLSNAETSGYAFDILSNGFKQRDNGAGQNASGGTYIYAAFAENPFKYSNAR